MKATSEASGIQVLSCPLMSVNGCHGRYVKGIAIHFVQFDTSRYLFPVSRCSNDPASTLFVMSEYLKTSCQVIGLGTADGNCGGARLSGSLAGRCEWALVPLQRGLARWSSNGAGNVVSVSQMVHRVGNHDRDSGFFDLFKIFFGAHIILALRLSTSLA